MKSLASILGLAALAAPLFAQDARAVRAPAALAAPEPPPHAEIGAQSGTAIQIDHSRMHYDDRVEGAIWARGRDYKASFGPAGAVYVPRLGAQADKDHALRLSPSSVTVAGAELTFDAAAPAARRGDRIELDRGTFVEAYEMGVDAIEQTFVFRELPARGEIVLTIPLSTDLAGSEAADALELAGSGGKVTYGRAVALDAAGRRAAAATELADGAIRIRVDADFVAQAVLPLVVDPVITTVVIDAGGASAYSADVAYDATTNRWLFVYEEEFSAWDKDVFMQVRNGSDLAYVSSGYVDFSRDRWTRPRCANLNQYDQFLVVASVVDEFEGRVWIRGCTVSASPVVVSPQFIISSDAVGYVIAPDVGGDPFEGVGNSFYCVAFERVSGAAEAAILVRLVMHDRQLLAGPVYLSNSPGTLDALPSVSKSNGETDWLVTWQRQLPSGDADIWGGKIAWTGSVSAAPFRISTSSRPERNACSSSPILGTQKYLVAYEQSWSTHNDVVLSLVDGTSVVTTIDLSQYEDFDETRDQIEPCVDSDGQHFLVAYSESTSSGSDYDAYASEVHLSTGSLGLSQIHELLSGSASQERRPRIASNKASGETDPSVYHRYVAAWDDDANAGSGDIEGAVFGGHAGGPVTGFCSGDGSTTSCPCGNAGAPGHGCASSVNPSGALLAATGAASTLEDSFVLTASGMPGSALCIFFQGVGPSHGVPPAVLGDGLRCATGTVIRLGAKVASGGTASYPQSGDQPVHVRGQIPIDGVTRAYQVWYRNPPPFCTSATFNTTNGVLATWTR